MKTIQKAIELRRASRLKSREPELAFQNRLKHARHLLELAEASHLASSAKFEARRQYVVCLAAAFELFWRDLVKLTVNRGFLTVQRSPHLGRLNFTLADVQEIIGRKLTLGELVASAYTFQSPETVNYAVSQTFAIDAFAEFRRMKFALVEVPRKNRSRKHGSLFRHSFTGAHVLKNIPLISKCFEIRHSTVHDTGVLYRISYRKVISIEGAINTFNVTFGRFVEGLPKRVKRKRTA